MLSAACTGLALVLLATVRADTVPALTVAFLLCLGYALDSADGQVSRLTGSGSPRGEWLDHMVDCTKTAALHLCVLIHLVRFTDLSGWELLVPLAYAVVDQVTFFGQILTDQLRRTLDIGPARNVGSLSVVRSLALLPADYGFLALLFSTLAWPHIFWWFYAGMLLAASALLLVALVRWWQMLPGPRQAKP